MRSAGLLTEGALRARLSKGGPNLHQGELMELVVEGPAYPVHLRIDYFTLTGEVLHLAPSGDQGTPDLAASSSRVFGHSGGRGDWFVGGEPFGTEMITVIATPAALNLGARPIAEKAADYLRDLKRVLARSSSPGMPNQLATLLVHTSPR
jgi:hypothetical protein